MFSNLLLLLFITLFNADAKETSAINYDLNKPIRQFELPAILNEISGLTDIDSEHVACIQDELGIIFVYNFLTGRIVSQHEFDSPGDFEGLTYTKSALFILRSDGRLSEWKNFPAAPDKVKHQMLSLVTDNNEGLCYDPKYSRLLIAAKSKPMHQDSKSERLIYELPLASKKLNNKPAYSLNVELLGQKAIAYNLLNYNKKNEKGKTRQFNFRPSSLAVHPQSDDIYIISAADKLLVVINRKGVVTHMEPLDPQRFTKAEGITFLADGTMIITNEAGGKVPTLLVYKSK